MELNKILYKVKKIYTFASQSKRLYSFDCSNLDVSLTKNNIPPMPLFDAHLGGFSFLI